jgi:hypothetical protein
MRVDDLEIVDVWEGDEKVFGILILVAWSHFLGWSVLHVNQ